MRIADIAVGSGVFLVTAYDLIVDKVMELKGYTKLTSSTEAPLDIKKELYPICFFGADIDKHAVQITKFSLGLRLLKGEHPERFKNELPLIPAMDKNIINGNSLVSEDDVAVLLRMMINGLNQMIYPTTFLLLILERYQVSNLILF